MSVNDFIDKYIRNLKIKFNIENIRLHNMYWMPYINKKLIKTRFIITSPKSIKPSARTLTSIVWLLFRQIKAYSDKCRVFLQAILPF